MVIKPFNTSVAGSAVLAMFLDLQKKRTFEILMFPLACDEVELLLKNGLKKKKRKEKLQLS